MYCKLFASLYQGTLRGRAHEILVFTNLLANADQFGFVDKHFRAIAEEVGLTQAEVEDAIKILESPDHESRSPEANGCRIQRLDEHRVWGWKIVNYGKYRSIRSEEDRREQNRLAQIRWREKQGKPVSNFVSKVSKVSRRKPPSAQAEAEAEAEAEGKTTTKLPRQALELVRLWEETLGDQWVNDAGKWVNRCRTNPKKSERVLAEVCSAITEKRISTTPAQYAEQIWKEFK